MVHSGQMGFSVSEETIKNLKPNMLAALHPSLST